MCSLDGCVLVKINCAASLVITRLHIALRTIEIVSKKPHGNKQEKLCKRYILSQI